MVQSYKSSITTANTNYFRFSGNRKSEDDLDEVYPRVFMSGFSPAECFSTLKRCGITHVLSVSPASQPKFASKGITYLLLDKIQDNDSQNIV